MRLIRKKDTGLLHAPPDGRPSRTDYDFWGRPTYMAWHKDDLEHRLDGPSVVEVNPRNGVHSLEIYLIEGEPRPKSQGYHIVHRDKESGEITGTLTDEDWFRENPHVKPSLDPPEFT